MAATLVVYFVIEITAQIVVLAFAGKPFRSLSFYRWSAYGLVRNNPDLTSPAFVINRNGFRATRTTTRRSLRVCSASCCSVDRCSILESCPLPHVSANMVGFAATKLSQLI